MIRFDNVTKVLSGKPVLNGIDFKIERGETFCIVGASGAGKSVTLKHMVRLMTPDDGSILVGDDEVSSATGEELARIRNRFGYLFQSAALLAWLSVAENVALPLREKHNMTDEEILDCVHKTLAMVGLEADGEKLPSEISGGMRKRAGLARAIVENPEIVLYDEPTSGLDPVTSRTIDRLIGKLREDLGVTSVVVTHDLHSALAIGTRIAMLHQGRVAELATPEAFMESSSEEVQRFLASQYITKEAPWERDLQ
ncbi:MAG: ATP-binding cassette domain-containing protein [Kiritimatiellae bacterium]|nr:ATP-binding cassette domain-containing protein [Kiritimatiellia bacterium]